MRKLGLAVVLSLMCAPAHAVWEIEDVDQDGVGSYSSLKVDAEDRIHISYMAMNGGNLKYALYDGLAWHTEMVDEEGLVGHFSSIDVDAFGDPHIAYVYYTGHNIRYARRQGDAWTYEDIETDEDVEYHISMALDDSGQPHICYHDDIYSGGAHDLKYARRDGDAWTTVQVDVTGNVGRGCSIALDSFGHPHIAYLDETNVTLKYAHFDGTQWHLATLDDLEYIGFNFRTAIAIDSADRIHIAYSAYHYRDPDWMGRLKYATGDGSTWDITIVDEALPTRDFRIPAIAMDAGDRPHISYMLYYNVEAITPDMKYAHFDGELWRTDFIDIGDMADSDNSNGIDIDRLSRVHVSYAENGMILKHASSQPVASLPEAVIPSHGFALLPPPNPMTDGAAVRFRLPRDADISLEVFDVAGRHVTALARGHHPTGEHVASLPAGLSPGAYLCRLRAEGFRGSQKLIVP